MNSVETQSAMGEAAVAPSWTDRSIDDVFRETAARFADRIAIDALEEKVTYAEFDARVDRIAARLRETIGESRGRIALYLDRSIDALAGIFGVLRAGGAYVALDPSDPESRVRFILADCGASAIVTDARRAEKARALAGPSRKAIVIDGERTRCDPTATRPAPDDLAYLVYTSGSTGRPKGVMQTHRNLLHYVAGYCRRLAIAPRDRLSMLYSLSFSAAHMDIYGALLTGATLCPYNIRRSGADGLARWLGERGVTVLHAVPTLYRHLIESTPGDARFEGVRVVDLGGEPVYYSDLKLHRSRFRPDCPLINHLAASEASVIAQHAIEDAGGEGAAPVGRAAPGIEIRIVRPDGSRAAANEIGEIVIASPHLSPGYWGNPELTASAFADDPSRPGWREYRGGDLGRIDADGLLTSLGRKDDRVKVRGHGVHLSEVEAAIRGIDGAREAVVVAIAEEGAPVESVRLVAYLTIDPGRALDFHGEIASRLPDYMRPAEVHVLESLPRTATGKVDRRALGRADRPKAEAPRPFEPPANAIEAAVASIYGGLLGVERVGRGDDFFLLGGDSLRMAQLQLRLRRELGHEATLGELLDDATVSGVAEAIGCRRAERRGSTDASSAIVALNDRGSRPPLFLVHGALGQAFVSPSFLSALGEDQPVFAFQARGADGREAPHRRVADMAAEYIEAMRRTQPSGPYYLAGMCAGGIVAHEMARRLSEDGHEVAALALIDPLMPRTEFAWPARLRKLATLAMTRLPIATRWARKSLRRAQRKVMRRGVEGRNLLDIEDPSRVDAAVRVAIDFRIAALRFKPGVYPGPAYVLASRERIERDWRKGVWHRALPGEVRLHELGGVHDDLFDPINKQTAERLRHCLDEARAKTVP